MEWAQLDLQSIQHRDYFGHLSIWISAIFHLINLPFDEQFAEKILNVI